MTVNRISTYNMHQSTLTNASRVMTDLYQLQNQISSGVKSSTYAGMSEQVEQFTALDSSLARSSQYVENNKVASNRLNATGNALEEIIQMGTDMKNTTLLRRNSGAKDNLAFAQQLEGYWKTLTGQLNSTFGGRYLFSGTATNQEAVDTKNFPQVNDSGQPNDDYYLGSNDDIVSRVQDGFDATLNIRANDPGVQKMFAALALAKKGHENNSDELLAKAYDMANEAVSDITTLQTSVNANKIMLDKANTRLDSLTLYWKGVKEEIINTDIVSASTQVAVNQGILQASFQVFANINSLHLSDFLK